MMSEDQKEPTVTVSMSRKINLGNYESAECFVSVSGVRVDMTDEDIAPLLQVGKVAWEQVRVALIDQVRDIKRRRAEGDE